MAAPRPHLSLLVPSLILMTALVGCGEKEPDGGGGGDDGGGTDTGGAGDGGDGGGDGGAGGGVDTAPSAPALVIEPEAPTTLDALTATITTESTDPEGRPVTYAYTWTVDGAPRDFTTESVPSAETEKNQTWTVSVTANDGTLDSEAGTASVTVLNSAPSLSGALISDTAPPDYEDIGCTPEGAADADADDVTASIEWFINGTSAATGETLSASETEGGDEVWCVITPHDGEEAGEPVTSETATVLNGAPQITALTLTPDPVFTDDVLTAEVEVIDEDGDDVTLTYAWFVDGVEVAGETTNTLEGAFHFDKGQTVYVTVTPDDGVVEGSTETSTTLTVQNSAPNVPDLAISPRGPTGGTELIATIGSGRADPDGDSVTYTFTWKVDGAIFTTTSTTDYPDDTIDGSYVDVGQLWEVKVAATDGTDTSDSIEDSVIITDWAGAREFTTCGGSGREGPTQSACDTEYTGTTLESSVVVSGGVQEWVVPSGGDYVITAYGAQGASGTTSYEGGWGARAEATVTLTGGETIYIIVGQEGVGAGSGNDGGGGGGTFVVDQHDTPIVIAGGGGGTRTAASQDGCDGRADQYGGAGSASSSSSSCSARSSGLGEGGSISGSSWGSAGAGFNSNGASERTSSSSSWGGDGGYSWYNGGFGGEGNSGCGMSADGGFGGGGSGDGCYGGGGGGGYSGGDGGWIAGGGGSHTASTATSSSTDAGYNEGDGWVVIDRAD